MDCSDFKDLIFLYSEDLLEEEKKEFLEKHLRKCEDCRNFSEKEKIISGFLRSPADLPLMESSRISAIGSKALENCRDELQTMEDNEKFYWPNFLLSLVRPDLKTSLTLIIIAFLFTGYHFEIPKKALSAASFSLLSSPDNSSGNSPDEDCLSWHSAPFSGNSMIYIPDSGNRMNVSVYNASGKLVTNMRDVRGRTVSIDKNKVSNGVYLIKLDGDDFACSRRIIVNR
ncbi:MAG: T9SS type A sorting domain-containing protein [Fibrobacterota bacterium]